MAEQRFAVIIGVNDPGVGADLPSLRYAERDATAVYDTLCNPDVGTFGRDGTTLYIGADATAGAVKSRLRRIAIGSDRSDLLLVYFAGHTLTRTWNQHEDDVYLVTPDLDGTMLAEDPDAGLRMRFLLHDVFALFAGTILVVLDCCRAGRLAASEGVEMRSFGGRDNPRRAMLFACTADGFAREDTANRHGALTHHVLRALRGQAADAQGEVSFESMSKYVLEQGLDPRPYVFLQASGTTVLTRPGGAAASRPRHAPAATGHPVEITSLEFPLDRHAAEVVRLVERLSREAQEPATSADPASTDPPPPARSRVEYLRSAVGAGAVAYLSRTAGRFVTIDATDRFDLGDVRHLLRAAGDRMGVPPGSRWFGHVVEDDGHRLWCAPLGRAADSVQVLAVVDPPDWLVELGQPGAKILETVWRADFAGSPAEAEIQVLTALRAAFGRLPELLFDRCLALYREVLSSFEMVFQPVVTIGEAPTQVGVHSYEALARRSAGDAGAPIAMLQVAHTWGDRFVIERDEIIVEKALSAYAAAHAASDFDVQKPVSVNVSVRSLLNDSYIDTVRRVIAACHLDPDAVTLEISEHDAIEPWEGEQWREAPHTYFHNRLAAITRDVGIAFAVDDFGTGYASVSRMAELPLTQIKVDRAILHHRQALRELELVVAVARDAIDRGEHHAARVVVVEGVDAQSPVTLRQIFKRGIKHVQGHITGERGAPELRRLPAEMRKEIAARVRGDDGTRPAGLTRADHSGTVAPLRRGA